MKLYIHRAKKVLLDYGDVLETVTGVLWSLNGEDAFGFEEGKTPEVVRERIAQLSPEEQASVELLDGKAIEWRVDMNPHGFI